MLFQGGRPRVVITTGSRAAPRIEFAAGECARHLERLCGSAPEIRQTTAVPARPSIMIGRPEDHPGIAAVARAGHADYSGLGRDDFLVRSISAAGMPHIIAGGGSDIGTLYAVYALLEKLGFVFRISGDLLPEPRPDLPWPELDLRINIPFPQRGYMKANIYVEQSIWSLDDYRAFFDNMVKTRCNYFHHWVSNNDPWVDFEFRGEHPMWSDHGDFDSACMLWPYQAASYRVADIPVGRKRFAPRRTVAPPELQGCRDERELAARAREFLRAVIREARARDIEYVMGLEICGLPANLGRLCRIKPPAPFFRVFGAMPAPTDETYHQINEARIRAIAESYPELSSLALWAPEFWPSFDHPDDEALYQRIREQAGPVWDIVVEAFARNHQGINPAALNNDLGFVHIVRKCLESRDRVAPGLPISVATICRAHALPLYDALLPPEIDFLNMEGTAPWRQWYAEGRAPTDVTASFAAKRRYKIVPRHDEDAHMLTLNYAVGGYLHDRFAQEMWRQRWAGYVMQLNRPRGMEHHSRFFMEAAVEGGLTQEDFYRRYVRMVFGEKPAARMFEVFSMLEAEDARLWWGGGGDFCGYGAPGLYSALRGLDCSDKFEGPLRGRDRQRADWWEGFLGACRKWREDLAPGVAAFDAVMAALRKARRDVPAGARGELEFLIMHTRLSRTHYQLLSQLLDFAAHYEAAFAARLDGDRETLLAKLGEARRLTADWVARIRRELRGLANRLDHVGLLGSLFRFNSNWLIPYQEFAKFVAQVDDYHNGRAYWIHPPDWSRVVRPDYGQGLGVEP
jgi:hypothetical protein